KMSPICISSSSYSLLIACGVFQFLRLPLQSLLLALQNPLLNPESFQDFRGILAYRQRLVAGIAILRNRGSVFGCVRPIVAPKAAWKIGMAQVVGISAPRDFQIGENVAVVNCKDGLFGVGNVLSPPRVDFRILLLIGT